MRKEIIDEMTSIVEDFMASYKSDFYNYDKQTAESESKPFLWLVSKNHTALQVLRTLRKDGYDGTVAEDYRYILNVMNGGASIRYYLREVDSGESRIYYCSGESLRRIDGKQAALILDSFDDMAKCEFRDIYTELPRRKTTKLIVNPHIEDKGWLMRELDFAKTIGDTSLRDCIRSLGQWRRCSLKHTITISPDRFANHSLGFAEVMDDCTKCCGGIIYSETPYNGKHWSIHT